MPRYIRKHPDAWEPFKELTAYATILNYILQQQQEQAEIVGINIKQSIVEKIMQRCQEITHNVEDFVNKLAIATDPELDATLEHLKQMSWNV